MTIPQNDEPFERLYELTSSVMHDRATEAEKQELNALLRDDMAARDAYLAYVDLHAVLNTQLAEPASTSRTVGPATSEQPGSFSARLLKGIVVAAATVAVLILCFQPFIAEHGEETTTAEFATIVQVTDTVWDTEAASVGDRLGCGSISLRDGFVRLEFDSGVEVTLQGPATLDIQSSFETVLTKGLLTANVPPGAEGFTVDTPTVEVIDLGTSFGVDLREDGYSNVTVFDGEVELALHGAPGKRLLSEGESVQVGTDLQIESVEFDAEAFEKVWPLSSGIAGSSDAFQFVPPWPRKIRFVQSNDVIFVAREGQAVELSKPLGVNISKPGKYVDADELSPGSLPAGQRVRSYILHYSPVDMLGPRRAPRVKGSITFDRPVVGLITQHEELRSSMRRFALRGAGELQHRRQLDLTGGNNGDRVTLSEDRLTLTLDLISPGRNSDLIRVIVEGGRRQARRP